MNELLVCCITMLELLIKCYREGNIDYKSYKDNSDLKVYFLQQNIDVISENDKKAAFKIINEHSQIVMQHSDYYAQ